jgi:hypothetical protein
MKKEMQKGNRNRATLAAARKWWHICLPWIGNNGISYLRKNAGLGQHKNCLLRKQDDPCADCQVLPFAD